MTRTKRCSAPQLPPFSSTSRTGARAPRIYIRAYATVLAREISFAFFLCTALSHFPHFFSTALTLTPPKRGGSRRPCLSAKTGPTTRAPLSLSRERLRGEGRERQRKSFGREFPGDREGRRGEGMLEWSAFSAYV